MADKATYNVQGNYVNSHSGKRAWANWMTDLTLKEAKRLKAGGNSLCTKLRIVKVTYEVIE